jgi:uncharacterized protein YacL
MAKYVVFCETTKKQVLRGELFMSKSRVKSGTKGGLGQLIWSLSVALYLIAIGVLGLNKRGDFKTIFDFVFEGSFSDIVVTVVSIIALLAGILVLFNMFRVKFSFLDELLFVVAIIWFVYVVIQIIYWLRGGLGNDLWGIIQKLAANLMVLGSLLIASKRFGG